MTDTKQPPKSVATELVDLALSLWDFGISIEGDPFALPKTGPRIVAMLRGGRASLRAELAKLYQELTKKVASQSALADALTTLEGYADATEPVPLALRVAYIDGAAWLDLGDLTGRAVKITPDGWTLDDAPPILFRRTALTGTLPEPDRDGNLDDLWALLNVTEESRPVLIAWLLSSLLPDIPHPILAVTGEQGTGKSTGSKMLAGLLDPSPAQLRKPPRDVDGWVTAAAGSWCVGVDNISAVPDWWSDALCRAVTGDGDVRRRLYSDAELTVFAFRRVVLVNGIDLGAVRDDLADRLLTVEFQRLTERRYDAELTTAWEAAHPRILGALLDLAADVLALRPTTRLDDPPRMADFGRVLATVDRIKGTTGLATYMRLGNTLAADAVASDPVLIAITEHVTKLGEWIGTSAELLALIGEGTDHGKGWPQNARQMTGVLRRQAPSLRRVGWTVDDLGKTGKACAVNFLIKQPASDASDDHPASLDDQRQATGKRQASDASEGKRQASDNATDACRVDHDPTREDTEKASDASDASVNPKHSPLSQIEREEEGGAAGVGPDGTLATLATLARAEQTITEHLGGRVERRIDERGPGRQNVHAPDSPSSMRSSSDPGPRAETPTRTYCTGCGKALTDYASLGTGICPDCYHQQREAQRAKASA